MLEIRKLTSEVRAVLIIGYSRRGLRGQLLGKNCSTFQNPHLFEQLFGMHLFSLLANYCNKLEIILCLSLLSPGYVH